MDTSQNTGKKRTTLIVALVACLVLAVGAGVFAWFSTQDTKTNTFVANEGVIRPPVKPDKIGPTDPSRTKTIPPIMTATSSRPSGRKTGMSH